MTTYENERFSASRVIAAPPSAVFAVLTDPAKHQDTEPGDWVRDAIEPQRITELGQVFGMNMYIEQFGDYVMHNRVIAFEPDTTIAWEPGQYDDQGRLDVGGWIYRYDLAPADGGTAVTLTYDWSATPQAVRDEVGTLPPFGPDFLADSLASLDRTVTRTEPERP